VIHPAHSDHNSPQVPIAAHDGADTEAVELLRSLVAIPSVSRNEKGASEFLVRAMTLLGLRASIDSSGSVVGVRGSSDALAKEIVLLGHIDTVPGHISIRVEDDCLYGRGSVDAKGPLAAFTLAAARATLTPGTRVKVIGAVEEEISTSSGARLAATRDNPVACIIGEPSGEDGITIGYKGRLIAELSLSVAGSHSAGPEPTAGEMAFEIWKRVVVASDAFAAQTARAFDRVQSRLRSVHTSSDGLEERAEMSIGFRLPPGVLPSMIEDLCRRSADEMAADVKWSFVGHELACLADRSNAVVRALSSAIRETIGVPRIKVKTGTSDMNIVAPVWGCPIAAYGPGDSSLDHTPNEHIRLSEYLRSIQVLTRAVGTLSAEAANSREGREETAIDTGVRS